MDLEIGKRMKEEVYLLEFIVEEVKISSAQAGEKRVTASPFSSRISAPLSEGMSLGSKKG